MVAYKLFGNLVKFDGFYPGPDMFANFRKGLTNKQRTLTYQLYFFG